jgi:hypothetical protein
MSRHARYARRFGAAAGERRRRLADGAHFAVHVGRVRVAHVADLDSLGVGRERELRVLLERVHATERTERVRVLRVQLHDAVERGDGVVVVLQRTMNEPDLEQRL